MLELGKKVFSNYKIASIGFEKRSDAYKVIRRDFTDCDATTYFEKDTGLWYIVIR